MVINIRTVIHGAWNRDCTSGSVDVDSIGKRAMVVPFIGFEIGCEAVELVVGTDSVSGHRPHPFSPLLEVSRSGIPTVDGDVTVTPDWVTPDLSEEIEEVGVEIQEELIPSVRAVHSVDAGKPGFTDFAFLDQRNGDVLDRRVTAPGTTDNQEFVVCVAGSCHLVDFGGGGCQGLFYVDVRPDFLCGQNEIPVVSDFARCEYGDIRAFLLEHFAVVGVGGFCAGFGLSGRTAFVIRVGEGDYVRAFNTDEGHVEVVAVFAAIGVSDYGYCLHFVSQCCEW